MGDEREGGAAGSPWAYPGEQPPAPPQAPPPPQPFPPYQQPNSSYAQPYQAPYQPLAYAPAPPPYVPPPARWARPAADPQAVTPATRLDPWMLAGWRNGSDSAGAAVRLLAIVTFAGLLFTILLAAVLADEREAARDQRANYVEVPGVLQLATEFDDDPSFTFSGGSPEVGRVALPWGVDYDGYPGKPVEALVHREDHTEFLRPEEWADPGTAVGLVVFAVVSTMTAGLACWLVHRYRVGVPAGLDHVAARAPEGDPPQRLYSPPPVRRARAPYVAAGLLAFVAVVCAFNAADARSDAIALTTVQGVVINGSTPDGEPALAVRYYDERQQGSTTRLLTPQEAARYEFGDEMPVRSVSAGYVPSDGYLTGFTGYGVLAAALALWLAWRPLAWRRRLARAARAAAHPVDVIAWTRITRGRPWLVLLPPAEARVRRAVAVPLAGGRDIPPALIGKVYVHGEVRRGAAVIVREPNGGALWPAGLARSAWFSEVTFVPPAPPERPRTPGYAGA